MRSSFAVLFGRVMPFWMAGSTLRNVLLLPFAHLDKGASRLAAVALTIQILAVVFSLAGPVPINNRIAKWTPDSLPAGGRAQEHRWDVCPWFRTCGLIAAFTVLVFSIAER